MAQFTNQAQLSYNNTIRNSNIAVGEILEVLSATKTPVSTQYDPNGDAAYVISIVNSGTTAFANISVSDDLGEYTSTAGNLVPLTYEDGTLRYYVNGILQPTPTVTAGPPLVVSGLNIPAGATAMLVYEANVNSFAPPGEDGVITNTATISGGGVTPITATATLPAGTDPNLSITKSVSPVPVTENGTLTYTFVIQNTGNRAALASDNAVIQDTFNPILENITVSYNGTPWVEGTDYNYDETTGVFTSVPGRITVPAAEFTPNPDTGAWVTTPGISTLIISGTV